MQGIYNVKNYDLLVITPYMTYPIQYLLLNDQKESNDIPTSHVRHRFISGEHRENSQRFEINLTISD